MVHRIIASAIFTGYFPFASGTFASLIALLIFLTPLPENYFLFGLFVILFLFLSIHPIKKFEAYYGHDPAEVTIDEWIGMWVSLFALPIDVVTVFTGFFLFRVLDVLKPYPAGFLNRKHGPLMVLLDDLIVAAYVNVFLRIAIHFGML